MNLNSTPPEGLGARESACGVESRDLDVEATNGPQAATRDPDPRAALLDAISTALNAAGYWLPIDGKKAVVEAVVALGGQAADPRPAVHPRTRCRCDHPRDLHSGTDCAGCTRDGQGLLAKHAFIAREDQP
ncbi:hypothetical protein [Streptomyces flavochromogenes]|uniref:hypothetical protein n=1 Tax=Streptomyces flavochromogenes TaxID=68199 RepID=UPI0004C0BCD9|nr:hypothetical protein [Streptomyces flavochromogenes]